MNKIETWFYIIIAIFWALSSLMQYLKKKAAEKEAYQLPPIPTPHKMRRKRERKATRVSYDDKALREAEKQVQNLPSRPVPVGPDLEVNVEDLFKTHGTWHEQTQSEHIREEVKPELEVPARPKPKRLQPLKDKGLLPIVEPETVEFSASPLSLILGYEILGPCKSERLPSRRNP